MVLFIPWAGYNLFMWFRSFLLIFLSFVVYGFFHSWLASNQVKIGLFRRFPSLERSYRLLYSVFALVSLVPILFLIFKVPGTMLYRIPSPWIYLTLGVQLVLILLLFVGVRQTNNLEFLGIRQLITGKSDDDRLVVSGLYRIMRHPIYTLSLALMWLFPVMHSNLLALFLSITGYILVGTFLEERKLNQKYPEYQEYQKKIPMFLPKLR